MPAPGTVVVGGGQAALQVATSLREGGYADPIRIVGAEPHLPYQRPPLSKAYLSGRSDAGSLRLRGAEFYRDQRIEVLTDQRVTELCAGSAGRRAAVTAAGMQLGFDHVVLATGARNRQLQVPGADLGGVRYLRDLRDADLLRVALEAARDVVVVGGGFIGLEAASIARQWGRNVTLVEAAPRLMSRAVAPVISDFYRDAHRRRGTDIVLDEQVTALEGRDGRVSGVVLGSGRVVPADLVVVGIGVVPRMELAEQVGARCDRGIVVDGLARTSVEGVLAVGDCTVSPDPTGGPAAVRLESVQHAIDQARVAASTILGRFEPYRATPWFWSDQADLKLQIAGLSADHDRHLVRGSTDDERFSVLYFKGERLVGVDAVNRPADFVVVRRLLERGLTVSPEDVADGDVPLKSVPARPVRLVLDAEPVLT